MKIELIEHQTCKVYVKLLTDEEFDVYGGTTKNQFSVSKTESGEHLVLITAPTICSCGGTGFDVFARRKSSNQEWLILSGRINTKDRKSSVSGTAVSPLEYHLEIPVTENIEELEVPPVYVGIKGERGDSAYELAVQNGYEGSEAEFVELLTTIKDSAQRAVDAQILAEVSAVNALKSHQDIYDAQILAEVSAVNALKYVQEAKEILEEIKQLKG